MPARNHLACISQGLTIMHWVCTPFPVGANRLFSIRDYASALDTSRGSRKVAVSRRQDRNGSFGCSQVKIRVVRTRPLHRRYNIHSTLVDGRRLLFAIFSRDPRHFTINDCRITLAQDAIGDDSASSLNIHLTNRSGVIQLAGSVKKWHWT